MTKETLIPTLVKATMNDYPTIQNMARFYVYDMSRTCGGFPGWECPADGLYESFDFKNYFEEPDRYAFLVRVENEIAGFVLINKVGTSADVDWNVGEFFILAKFQGKSIGTQVAMQVWDQFPGVWEVSVIPENNKALRFWRRSIVQYSQGHYSEDIKSVDYDPHQPQRIVFRFTSPPEVSSIPKVMVIRRAIQDDVNSMVVLSDQKRRSYEQAQPQFWHRAQNANEAQIAWFMTLLDRDDYILLVAEDAHKSFDGFIIGQLIKAPEVYNPGGLTLMIDDFCVASPYLWHTVGSQLLDAIQPMAKVKGAVQNLIVCGHHDEAKREFLRKQGMNVASEWYV